VTRPIKPTDLTERQREILRHYAAMNLTQAEDELFQVQSRLANYVERLERAKGMAGQLASRIDQLKALQAEETKIPERKRLDEAMKELEQEQGEYEVTLPGLERLKAEYEFRLQNLPVARIKKANEHEARKANALRGDAPSRLVGVR